MFYRGWKTVQHRNCQALLKEAEAEAEGADRHLLEVVEEGLLLVAEAEAEVKQKLRGQEVRASLAEPLELCNIGSTGGIYS
jgi:hypothetical protein